MNNPEPETHHSPASTDSGGKSCLLVATILAACLIAGVFLVLNRFKRDLPPRLTRESFDTAWDVWQTNAPADYRIQIEVVGPQPATYAVEVADNQVVTAERNGDPLPPKPRTMRTWSVPGMFDTMEHDVMRIEKPEASQLSLRAEFDQELGYPAKYYRNDGMNKFEMRWTVTEFETE